MNLFQSMSEKIESLVKEPLEETSEKAQQPLKLVETTAPEAERRSSPLTAEQGEEIKRLLRTLPGQAAQEIVTQTEPLRKRLGLATDHAFITKKAMEDLAALVELLRLATTESRAAAAQMPAATKDLRREASRVLGEVGKQMSAAVNSERKAIRRDLSQIPSVRKYFGMCLLAMLLTSAISAGIFGLAWQRNKLDPLTVQAAETFRLVWERASEKERRMIEEIIRRSQTQR